jgi:hypothetical protein
MRAPAVAASGFLGDRDPFATVQRRLLCLGVRLRHARRDRLRFRVVGRRHLQGHRDKPHAEQTADCGTVSFLARSTFQHLLRGGCVE